MFNKISSNVVYSKKQGFSIAELSVVIVASGLMIFGALKAGDIVSKARVSATVSELNEIKSAIQNFKAINDSLPGDMASIKIKKQGETVLNFVGFSSGNGNGKVCWGSGDATSTANESLLANAHLVNGGYIDSPISVTAGDFALAAVPSASNLLKSTKLPDVYYTIIAIQKNGSNELAFATPADSTINFSGNNIVIGGIGAADATAMDTTAESAYFVNNALFATLVPNQYTPTKAMVSKKIVEGLANTFGASIKSCDDASKLKGACNTNSDLTVASLALLGS